MNKVRAVTFGSLYPGTIEIHVAFGYGLNDGGRLMRVDTNQVPLDCRMPNTFIWVELENGGINSIEKMTEKEIRNSKKSPKN